MLASTPRAGSGWGNQVTYPAPAVEHLLHVHGGELVKLVVVAAQDDDGHVNRAEHGQLMSLLEEAAFPLQKGAGRGGLASVGRALAGRRGASYTERFLSSLMGLISIFLRPILTVARGRDAGRYRDYGWIRLGVVVMWARDGG